MATNVARREYAKDTPDTNNFIDNAIYNEGPWSYCDNEVISSVVSGGSGITRWLPSRGVNWMREHVQHLVYVKPEDYDPDSETYGDFLAGLDPLEDCDYGPTPDWGACEYAVEMNRVSFQSKTITEDDLNIRQCKLSPIYTVRNPEGSINNSALATDAEWAVAQAGLLLSDHLDWNVWNGDPAAYELTYDGLDKIISMGYVDAHRVGDGDCKFVDPIVLSGLGLGSDLATLISLTRAVVRKILKRAKDRNRPLGQQDIALFMPSSHWNVVADALACAGLAQSCGTDIVINTSGADFRRERDLYTMNGPYGEGFFPTGGFNIGVITDDLLGYNTLLGGEPAVTGDWYVLTRRFAGMNILEQQFLDYDEVFNVSSGVKPNYRDEIIMQNGMIKQGWKDLNNKCWQAYVEMRGRIVSRYQPLQAKIQDITLPTFLENENESVNFASLDWYAA